MCVVVSVVECGWVWVSWLCEFVGVCVGVWFWGIISIIIPPARSCRQQTPATDNPVLESMFIVRRNVVQ